MPQANLRFPPYLVLLRVGFALPAALLQRRCALTAPFHPYHAAVAAPRPGAMPLKEPQRRRGGMFSVALSVEYRVPTLRDQREESAPETLPDVIRHTALWSSDFPPPPQEWRERPSGPAAYSVIICETEGRIRRPKQWNLSPTDCVTVRERRFLGLAGACRPPLTRRAGHCYTGK